MLPFYISRLLGLKSKTHGYALVNEQGIRLVFRDVADIEREPDEDAESLMINWNNLAGFESKHGLVADSLTIKVHTMVGRDPDCKDDNVIELDLEKRHRHELQQFEKHVREYQSSERRDDVDEVLDDVRDFLDRM